MISRDMWPFKYITMKKNNKTAQQLSKEPLSTSVLCLHFSLQLGSSPSWIFMDFLYRSISLVGDQQMYHVDILEKTLNYLANGVINIIR